MSEQNPNEAPILSSFELRLDHDELLSFDDYASGSQVSALTDGTFGVFWSDNDVYFQKVSPSGELIGSPLAIATNGAYRVRNIEGLSDGSALLTYENRNFLGGSEDYRHLHGFSVETGPYAGYGIWDPLTNVRINGGEDLTPTIEGRDWSEQGFGWLGGQWGWRLDNGDVLEASFNINTLEDLPVFDAGVTTRTFRQLGDAYSDDGSPVSVTVEFNGTVVFFGEVPTKLLSERPAPGPSLEPYVPPGELYAWEMPLDFTNGSYDLRIAVSGGVVDLSGSNANYQSQAQIIEVEHLDSSGLVIDADSYQLVDAIRPRIVDLEDGTYLIAWGGRASNGIEHGLGQIFTYDGVPLDGMEPFLITPDAALIPDSGLLIDTGFTIDRVGVNGDTLAVFWRGEKQNTETYESIKELHLRTYNLIDQSLINDITLLETSDDVYFNKTLDSLGNGFLVTWTEGPEDNATLYAQAVDLLGNTVIPKTTVDVGLASNDYYHVDVITLDDGSEVPVVFWIEPDPDSDTTGLQYFATLNSDLRLAGDPLLIEPEQPLNQRFAYEFFSDGAGLQLLRNRSGDDPTLDYRMLDMLGTYRTVQENSDPATVVYTANASDEDGDRLTYSLGGTDASLLTINSSTGAVTLKASADYETKDQYLFTVTASDGSLTDTVDVTLDVADVVEIIYHNTGLIEGSSADDEIDATANQPNWIQGGNGADTINLTPDGVWSYGYYALHASSDKGMSTGRLVSLNGMNQYADVTDGGADADTINLTDGSDAFFLDDVYSDIHSDVPDLQLSRNVTLHAKPRILDLETINAGEGDDLVDLTAVFSQMLRMGVTVNGDAGNDVLWGGLFADTLNGGAGNDVINGNMGNDTLTGGDGADIFEFMANAGSDTITDFSLIDKLVFYYREGEAEESAIASMNNGIVTWDAVTVDLGDSSLALSDLNITYELV